MRGQIALVDAMEQIIWSYPGARSIKNGTPLNELIPGQKEVESDVTTSAYTIPVILNGNKVENFVKVHFTYDKRIDTGFIRMSGAHIGLITGRDFDEIVKKEHVIRKLYNTINVGQEKARIDMTCFKCGHVVEHECW